MDGLVSILNEWSALPIYICLCVHFPDFTLCLHEVHKANTLISDQLHVCHTRFSALMSVKVWFILQHFPWLKCIQAMLDTSNIPLTHTFLLVAFSHSPNCHGLFLIYLNPYFRSTFTHDFTWSSKSALFSLHPVTLYSYSCSVCKWQRLGFHLINPRTKDPSVGYL